MEGIQQTSSIFTVSQLVTDKPDYLSPYLGAWTILLDQNFRMSFIFPELCCCLLLVGKCGNDRLASTIGLRMVGSIIPTQVVLHAWGYSCLLDPIGSPNVPALGSVQQQESASQRQTGDLTQISERLVCLSFTDGISPPFGTPDEMQIMRH